MSYWEKPEAVAHITPKHLPYPEPLSFGIFLRETFEGMHVADVGCGIGRLSSLFESIHYTGYDINQTAIDRARAYHPRRSFATMPKLVQREGVLMHTVLQHLNGAGVDDMLSKILCDTLVISEIMAPQLKNTTVYPHSYNRSRDEYIDRCAAHGLSLANSSTFDYGNNRYGPDIKLTALVFMR